MRNRSPDFEESREFGTLNMLVGRSMLSGFINITTIFGQSDKTLKMKNFKRRRLFLFFFLSFLVLFYCKMTNMPLNKRSRARHK